MTFTIDPGTGKLTANGADALTLTLGLYDTGGELRNQVLGLQAWIKALIGEDPTAAPAKPIRNQATIVR